MTYAILLLLDSAAAIVNFTLFVPYTALAYHSPLEYSNKAPFGHYSARWRSSVKPRTAKVSGSSSTP